MEWKKDYLTKVVSVDEATSKVKSGSTVVVGHACAGPAILVNSMVENKNRYKDIEIVHLLAMGKGEYTFPEMEGHFKHKALFVGGSTRNAVLEGRADYVPCFFHEVPSLFEEGYIDVDVALVQVSTPDENGYCSYGVAIDYTKPAAEKAKLVIAVSQNLEKIIRKKYNKK